MIRGDGTAEERDGLGVLLDAGVYEPFFMKKGVRLAKNMQVGPCIPGNIAIKDHT